MKEVLVQGRSLPEAYHKAILELHRLGDIVSCNDWDQTQKELSLTMVVENPLMEPMISKLYIGGFKELQQYVMEVLDGILNFKIGDSETSWEYTYHDRITNYAVNQGTLNQVDFVVKELRRSVDSRRAVIDVRDNRVDPFNPHPACLQNIQYFIRDEKLHCKVLMRSNDAAEATFMNAFAFVMLHKKIANELGVPVGTYTHRANSFHCYEKDYTLLQQYVDGINQSPDLVEDITYEYDGFYKDIMEETIPEIMETVEILKQRNNE